MPDTKAPRKTKAQKAAEALAEAPREVPAEAPVVESPPEAPLDAVIVVKTVEDGQIKTNVVVNGNVQITEVETLLQLGLKAFREEIGLT